MDTNTPTLFNLVPRCFTCGDLGFELINGVPATCWRRRSGAAHNEPSPALAMIARAIEKLQIAQAPIDPHALEVAKTLARHTSAKPCKRDRLVEVHFNHHPTSAVRNCAATIETLRRVWLLPVGSRKESPSGYWIITSMEDFADWVERAKSAPITQLTTIHRVAKRNFPVFADQMELDFWKDLDPQPLEAMAA